MIRPASSAGRSIPIMWATSGMTTARPSGAFVLMCCDTALMNVVSRPPAIARTGHRRSARQAAAGGSSTIGWPLASPGPWLIVVISRMASRIGDATRSG